MPDAPAPLVGRRGRGGVAVAWCDVCGSQSLGHRRAAQYFVSGRETVRLTRRSPSCLQLVGVSASDVEVLFAATGVRRDWLDRLGRCRIGKVDCQDYLWSGKTDGIRVSLSRR